MPTYHHGELRAAILEAAGSLLEKGGLQGVSVREAARRAGVSHSAPYRHFPAREALLAALALDGFNQLGKKLENTSGWESGQAYVRFALQHPQRFRLMFGGQIALDNAPALRAQAHGTFATLEKAFAGFGAEGNFAAAAAWSLVHGLAQLLVAGHFENSEKFAMNVLGVVRFAVGSRRSA